MANSIDHKLRLTAALLGAVTRKDLAAAFRRVNHATAYDIDRADKWLQGRAQPRQLGVYEDWAMLLDLQKPADWIAECDIAAFASEIASRHGRTVQELEHRAEAFGKPSAAAQEERGLATALSGRYACYSNSWSPYYKGQRIRGLFEIGSGHAPQGLSATYSESLPTGRLEYRGVMTSAKRGMYTQLHEANGDGVFLSCLFPFSPPGSVLGGFLCGGTVIGPEPQPSTSRIVMIRLKDTVSDLNGWGGYLDNDQSIASELMEFGLHLDHPETLDTHLDRFLRGSTAAGIDQIPPADFRALLDILDRAWLQQPASV